MFNLLPSLASKAVLRVFSIALMAGSVSHLAEATTPSRPQQLASLDQVPKGLAKSDWQSIRAAYEAGRHAFQPTDTSWQARNPGQQWTTTFDQRGFMAQPRDATWQWGLELQSYGWGDQQTSVTGTPVVKAEGQRLSYQWDATVQEWFVNDQRGLEHGFTVAQRPQNILPHTSLSFTLNTRGNLRPVVPPDALGLLFQDSTGATVLNYTGLKAWDANGKILTSRFEAASDTAVRLIVEDRGARYPITIDPIAQQAYLKASSTPDGIVGDRFGRSVAVSGNTVVVGASSENSGSTGVNGTPYGDIDNAGAAYVFVRNGNTWSQQAYLKASHVSSGDLFGCSVGISGDTIVIGALGEASTTTGVNSTPNKLASGAGAAFVFVRSSATWSQQAYLKASQVSMGDVFGCSVAISGNTVVVGARNEDSSSVGVNSAANESADTAGAAYVFVRSGSTWSQQAYLKPNRIMAFDQFGHSVSVSGGTVVVGALGEDSRNAGVNSTPNILDGSFDSGAAYIFVRSGSTWNQQAYLKANQVARGDEFGSSVAASDDTVVVGAIDESSSTPGVNSTPNNLASGAGAAYVFVRNGSSWSQQAYLKASQVTSNDHFGHSVAVAGNTAVVGAVWEDSGSSGINSTPNESTSNSGAAYVFHRTGVTWEQQSYLKASHVSAGDQFGCSVAVADDKLVIGAMYDDSSSTGINSTPDELATDAGAAFVFSGLGIPEITVEQPVGPPLSSGGSSYDFGTMNLGNSSEAITFTVKNSAAGTLTISGIDTTGDNADDFIVETANLEADLPFGTSTTFSVTFQPTTIGNRTTTLRIQSNDSDEAVFDITLSGTGIPSALVLNTQDDGEGSLRRTMLDLPAGQTITFAPDLSGQALTLESELVVSKNFILDASALPGGLVITDDGVVNHRLLRVTEGTVLTVRNVKFRDGADSTFTGNGGAIWNQGTLTLDRCEVSGSRASSGGGFYASANSTSTLLLCTVSGNTSPNGGGIMVDGRLTMTQCTLAGNSGLNGGAMAMGTNAEALLIQCTVAGNQATQACSGVLTRGTLALRHCILGQNLGSGAPFEDLLVVSGTTTLHGACIVEESSGTIFGPTAIAFPPLLHPLGNYGGNTQTMPPRIGSPAIDQALQLDPPLTTDQRGLPRPMGVRPDLGAVEGVVITVNTSEDELNPLGSLGSGISLREAIRDIPFGGMISFDPAIFTRTTTANTITLTKGPLNPPRHCTLDARLIPGGIQISHALAITQQPQPRSVAGGISVNFTVNATAVSGGLAFQWRKNGVPNGITTAECAIAAASDSDEGLYDVVLGEAAAPGVLTLLDVALTPANAISQPASLIVNGSPLSLLRHPASSMMALGSTTTLEVVAGGPASSSLTYQWALAGKNIVGASKSTYTITNAQFKNAGAYTCVVKYGNNAVTSTTAEIGVVDAHAKVVNLAAGGSFTALVSAAGTNLTYMWSNAQTAKTFNIKPVAVEHAGLYTCIVNGAAGIFTGGAPTQLNVSSMVPQLVEPLNPPQATIGQTYFWQIPVQIIPGAPATSFSITGALPAGITLNKVTGVLSGRPTASKPSGYPISIKAINAKGSSVASVATLMVNVVPPAAVAIFAGPLARSVLNDYLGGRLDLTTTAPGTFSGSITLGARAKLSFKNQLLLSSGPGDVILRGNISGISMADKTPLTAYVELFAAEQLARFTLVHPDGTTLVIPAWRNPWLISKTPALNKPATSFAAYYTARLNPENMGNAPHGYGFTSFTIAPAGTLSLAGKLPDGSAITGGTFVGSDGQIFLFNLLYGNRGSNVGQFTVTPASPVTDNALTGTLSWFKPDPLLGSKDTLYKDGFGPISLATEGSPYSPTAKGALILGLTSAATPAAPNASLAFTSGGMDFSQSLNISSKSPTTTVNVVGVLAPVQNSTKVTSLNTATGQFSGTFIVPGATAALNRPATFSGQISTVDGATQGWGYYLLPKIPVGTEKVTTSPKLSGQAVLSAP